MNLADQIAIIDNHIIKWSQILKDLPVDEQNSNDVVHFLFAQDVFEPDEFWELTDTGIIDAEQLDNILFEKWANAFTRLNRSDVVSMLQNVQLNGL